MARNREMELEAASRLARVQARHRLLAVIKIALIITVTMLASLIASGHKLSPEYTRYHWCQISEKK